MKTLLFLFVFITCQYTVTAQIVPRDQKRISGIVGKDFVVLANQSNYPYIHFDNRYKIEMSNEFLGDTVGVSYLNEQLLWYDLIAYKGKKEVLKMASPSYVTVNEYLEFQNYVRDSIARDMIYMNEARRGYTCWAPDKWNWTDEDSKEWINYSDFYTDSTGKYVEFDPSDKQLGRTLFSLNWDRSLKYTDPKNIPIVADMYYTPPERIYDIKEFDHRKLVYKYACHIENEIPGLLDSLSSLFPFSAIQNKKLYVSKGKVMMDKNVLTSRDNYLWLGKSVFERDEFSVLSQTYAKLLTNEPIVGINAIQANAFCHWKQEVLQKELDEKKLPYTVLVTLPTLDDQHSLISKEAEFTIPAKDYTEQWRITNKEYRQFIDAVQDSIVREELFFTKIPDEEANKFLNYQDMYFDEGNYEFAEFDPSDRALGRSLFPLNYDTKIEPLNEEMELLIDSVKKATILFFHMYTMCYFDSTIQKLDWKLNEIYALKRKASIKEDIAAFDNEENEIYEQQSRFIIQKIVGDSAEHYFNLSEAIACTPRKDIISGNGFQQYITGLAIDIMPKARSAEAMPDSLIQGLNYLQALAYYYWKYPLHLASPKDDWQTFTLPSAEQFQEIQKGKRIVIPEKKVPYPTPLFRYVVHVYPR